MPQRCWVEKERRRKLKWAQLCSPYPTHAARRACKCICSGKDTKGPHDFKTICWIIWRVYEVPGISLALCWGWWGHGGKIDPLASTRRSVTNGWRPITRRMTVVWALVVVLYLSRTKRTHPSGVKKHDIDLGPASPERLCSELIALQHITEQQHPLLSCQLLPATPSLFLHTPAMAPERPTLLNSSDLRFLWGQTHFCKMWELRMSLVLKK